MPRPMEGYRQLEQFAKQAGHRHFPPLPRRVILEVTPAKAILLAMRLIEAARRAH